MTIIEQIKAEIERRHLEQIGEFATGRLVEDADTLSSLSTLESEKPMDLEEELEKEIDCYYGMYRKDGKTYDIEDDEECADWKDIAIGNPYFEIAFARHFAEWGAEHLKK